MFRPGAPGRTAPGGGARWHEASADYAAEAHIPDTLLFGAWDVLDPP